MKVLFIGGTGNISLSASRLAVSKGIELYLLNRGTREVQVAGAKVIRANIKEPDSVASAVAGHQFDTVVDWIGFIPADMENDFHIFRNCTRQFIFISSASAYEKPLTHPFVTESTPLANPFWEYSRNKIACEDFLIRTYREHGFPVTIVRPSLTYDTVFPVAIGGWNDFTLVSRMRRGKRIISHGDGTSLWTITHAEDFAKGLVGLLGNPHSIGHSFHITSDEVLTWDQIYQAIAAAAGTRAEIVHIPTDVIEKVIPEWGPGIRGDKGVSAIFDNGKIRSFVPEFKATIPFLEGIRRTVAWFEADPKRMVIQEKIDARMDELLSAWDRAMLALAK